jgi:GTP-binding protein HflX
MPPATDPASVTHQAADGAVLVQLDLGRAEAGAQASLEEFYDLVQSGGYKPLATVRGRRERPDPHAFVGRGKLREIGDAVAREGAEHVLVNHALSPVQTRNLESGALAHVVDRTGLILKIFADRARSHEGKLQVEIARLRYASSRLIRGWTHLERQKGGIGLRGPGETQLETDRRLIARRIHQLEGELELLAQRRASARRARRSTATVSLVGYTNAGKSTLFNALSRTQDGEVADRLFATLDPKLRQISLPARSDVVLADTVGFIRGLPHELVAAFQATLGEVREAALLLHVIDASAPDRLDKERVVLDVLGEIGASDLPRLDVLNKIDRLGVAPHVERDATGRPCRVWIAAGSGEGLDLLTAAIAERLASRVRRGRITLTVREGAFRAALYRARIVVGERVRASGASTLDLVVEESFWNRICASFAVDSRRLRESRPRGASDRSRDRAPEASLYGVE